MGIFYTKPPKKTKISEQDKAILQLKQQRDNIKIYQKKLECKVESDNRLIEQLLQNGFRDKAKLLLKKKLYIQNLIRNSNNQLNNLEKLVSDIEFAQVQLKVIDGLKLGNEALKQISELLNVENVEKILEETSDGIQKQKEINDLLNRNFTIEDEEAVEDELCLLLEKEFPIVPTSDVIKDDESFYRKEFILTDKTKKKYREKAAAE